MRHRPDLLQRLRRQRLQARHRLAALLGQCGQAVVQQFQIQLDAGERLSGSRVQFARNTQKPLFRSISRRIALPAPRGRVSRATRS